LKVGDIDNYTREKRYIRKDGTFVWVSVTVSLQRAENGNPLFAIMVIEDITARKATEGRQRRLLSELNHRVKNIMSMTQSIANQSLRHSDSAERFVSSFRARLQAMARAHDLLTQESWQRANLAELVISQTTASGLVEPERIRIDGPGIFLSGQVALNFALVLHELTSNALRYGALSTPSGHIWISWTVQGEGANRIVHMTWQENDGPRVQAPIEQGFGTILIDRSLRQALGGTVRTDWLPTGLVLHIELPLREVARRGEYFNP
jgi:two-component sensor histidine kinase